MSNNSTGVLARSGEFINVGHGNFVAASRIIVVLESGSLPMRRLREKALESNQLIDATAGRKTRSLLVTDSGHVVLSALAPQTVQERVPSPLGNSPARIEVEEGQFVS